MSDGAVSEVCEGVGVEEVCVALGAVFEGASGTNERQRERGADVSGVSDEGEESQFARAQVAGAM